MVESTSISKSENLPPALVIGFGAAARGFVGPWLETNHYLPVFCLSANKWIWWTKKDRPHEYEVQRITDDYQQIKSENGYKIFDIIPCYETNNEPSKDILEHGKNVDLILTSIGPSNLKYLSKIFGEIINARAQANKGDLNIVLVENLSVSGEEALILRDEVNRFVKHEAQDYFEHKVGVVDGVIETTIMVSEDQLTLTADRFDENLYLNKSRIVGNFFDLINRYVQLESDIAPIRMRKLFVHNFADTATAYIGAQFGHTYIREAIEDPRVYPVVDSAFREIRQALSQEFDGIVEMSETSLDSYYAIQKKRMRSAIFKDEISRIARDPIRKLRPDDRLLGPATLAKKHGIKPVNLALCIKAAVDYWLDH